MFILLSTRCLSIQMDFIKPMIQNTKISQSIVAFPSPISGMGSKYGIPINISVPSLLTYIMQTVASSSLSPYHKELGKVNEQQLKHNSKIQSKTKLVKDVRRTYTYLQPLIIDNVNYCNQSEKQRRHAKRTYCNAKQ